MDTCFAFFLAFAKLAPIAQSKLSTSHSDRQVFDASWVRVRFLRGAKPPNPRAEASSAPTNLVNVVGRGGACLRPGPGPSAQKSYAHPFLLPDVTWFTFRNLPGLLPPAVSTR